MGDWTVSQWFIIPLLVVADGVVALSLVALLGYPVLMVVLDGLGARGAGQVTTSAVPFRAGYLGWVRRRNRRKNAVE